MATPTANPTPKTRFQEIKGAIDAHHTLIDTDSFKRGCDMALLEYQRKLAVNLVSLTPDGKPNPSANQQIDAMANGWKIQGVLEFLAEFRGLAEKAIVLQGPGVARTLDHAN